MRRYTRGAFGLVVFSIISCAALLPASASAEASRDQRAEAREHARQARIFYDLGRFEEALAEYEAAYQVLPAAGVLFNIGQCHRLLGNHERAIFFFEGYLRQAPEADNREDVEALIAQSREELERQAAAVVEAPPPEETPPEETPPEVPPEAVAPPPEPPPAVPPVEHPVYRQWWFWTVVGAVVVGTGLGVGLGVGLNAQDPQVVLPAGSIGVLDGRR